MAELWWISLRRRKFNCFSRIILQVCRFPKPLKKLASISHMEWRRNCCRISITLETVFIRSLSTKALLKKQQWHEGIAQKSWGRTNLKKPTVQKTVPMAFTLAKIEEYYDDPARQAEYLYSLIQENNE